MILKKNDNEANTYKSFIQFIKFGIVGVSNTLVSYAVHRASRSVFRYFGLFANRDNYAAIVVAYIVSVFWSFCLNSRFVFKQGKDGHRNWLKALMKTYLSYMFTGLVLSNIFMFFWLEVAHISENIAPLLNSALCVPINFLLNKYWAFKEEKGNKR